MSEASNTEGQFSNPSFGEKIKSGVDSFKRKKIRESHDITRPTMIPGTENPRGQVERFERGEIYRAFLNFREEIAQAKKSGEDTLDIRGKLDDFRQKARVYEGKLDILNEQFYSSQVVIHIEDQELGILDTPVTTLDLNAPKEGEKDERIPYFIIPTYAANPHQVANFAMSLALEGQKVHVMTLPENRAATDTKEKIENWQTRVKNKGTLGLHVKLAEKIVDSMGLFKINLVGTSMGAPIAMQLASDLDFALRINDLIIVEPPSIITKKPLKFFTDFVVREAGPTMLDKEMAIKTTGPSERPDLVKAEVRDAKNAKILTPILAATQITQEMISRINPSGKFQIWIGEKSHITGEKTLQALLNAEKNRIMENPNSTKMKIVSYEGGHQTPFARLGVGGIITQALDPEGDIFYLSSNDMDRNIAQSILNGRYN